VKRGENSLQTKARPRPLDSYTGAVSSEYDRSLGWDWLGKRCAVHGVVV
jgi:hypothetical protein